MKNISRRTAIKTVLAGSAAMAVSGMEAAAPAKKKKVEKPEPLKGNIRHSVSKWCFGSYPLDEFCEICKNIGIESIELLDPKDWPIVQKHGLTVAMAQGAGLGTGGSMIPSCMTSWLPVMNKSFRWWPRPD